MFEMFISALKLFFRGKLFREPLTVMREWFIGLILALLMLCVLFWLGVAPGYAVAMTALVSGFLQPWLFRNLKYD